ncbi:jg26588 [Pararge aegeria aegeria]|uniref:Jg26588 protein n=1 Tax=Pararge aegeria aegeria TaxID=348720 RepID=A0A8S4QTZ0_9NEOP|nr:jg26588 [Pararge aegeria aegeria]
MLFNVYGEYIIRKALETWKGGFPLGGKRICNLRYADDTVLVTTSMKDMKELLQRLEVESLELGLCINKSKTKLMIVDRSGNLLDTTNIPSVDIVEDYIYLGSQICNDGSCVPEIERRIAMAKSAMIRLGSIWKNRGITFNTKSRLVRALIFPIFMYGVETWTIKARERQRIDAFEMWCWRRMWRIPWTAKRTNVSILAQLGVRVRLSSICYQRLFSISGT